MPAAYGAQYLEELGGFLAGGVTESLPRTIPAASRGAFRKALGIKTDQRVVANMARDRAESMARQASFDYQAAGAIRRGVSDIPPLAPEAGAGYRVTRGPKGELRLEPVKAPVQEPQGPAAVRPSEARVGVQEPELPIIITDASSEAFSAARRATQAAETATAAAPEAAAGIAAPKPPVGPLEVGPGASVTAQNVEQRLQEAFRLSNREASNVGALARARAEAWAAANPGKTADDWFAERLAAIRRGEPAAGIPGLAQDQAARFRKQLEAVLGKPGKDGMVSKADILEAMKGAPKEVYQDFAARLEVAKARLTPADARDFLGGRLNTYGQVGAPGTTKGMTQFLDDGRALITAMKKANASTAIHEFAHVLRRDLAAPDMAVAEKWAGVRPGGKWSVAQEEKFARAFERYVRDGVAPTAALKRVFENLRQIMTTIYAKLKGSAIDVEISPELRRVLDRQFQKGPELQPLLGAEAPLPGAPRPGFESMTRAQMFERGAAKMGGELSLDRVLSIERGKPLSAEQAAAVTLHLKAQQAEAARLKDVWELAPTPQAKAEAWKELGDRIEEVKILNDLNRQDASAAAQRLGLQDTINQMASGDAPVPPTIQRIMERRGINPRTLFQEEEGALPLVSKADEAGMAAQDADAVIMGTYYIERGAVNYRAWRAAMGEGFKGMPEEKLKDLFRTASIRAERDRLVALEAAKERLDPTGVFVERYANRPSLEVIQDLSRRYESGFMDRLTQLAVVDPLFNPANLLVKNPASNMMMQAARGGHIEAQALLGAARYKLFGGQAPRFAPGAGRAFYQGAREGLAVSQKLQDAMSAVSSVEGARDAILDMLDRIDEGSRAIGGSGAKAVELLEKKRPAFAITNFESVPVRAGKRILNVPGFILEANDRWMVNANRLGELYAESFSQGVRKGASATEAATGLRESAAALPPEIAARAAATAEKLAFRAELGKTAKLAQAIITSIPGGRFFVRYFRTPTNIAKVSIGASPFKTFYDVLNAARIPITRDPALRAQLVARYTGQNLDRVLTDAVLANAGAGLVAYWWANGRVTGKLANPGTKERAVQDALGMKEHSFRVGDNWVSYRGFGPFSQVAQAVTDGLGAAHKAQKGEQGYAEAFADAMAAGLVAAGDSGYIRFLQDLDRGFNADDPKLLQVLANTARSVVVPTVVAQAARLMDPNERVAQGTVARIQSGLPGLRNLLPVAVSPTGLPVQRSLSQALGLPAVGSPSSSLEADLAKQGVGISGSPKSLQRYRLTPQERTALVQERGQTLVPALTYLMATAWWGNASQMQKQAAVDHLTAAHKQNSPTYQAIVRRLAQQGVPVNPED